MVEFGVFRATMGFISCPTPRNGMMGLLLTSIDIVFKVLGLAQQAMGIDYIDSLL